MNDNLCCGLESLIQTALLVVGWFKAGNWLVSRFNAGNWLISSKQV